VGAVLAGTGATACTCKLSVPPDAQAVHLTMDDAGIHLDPDTVRAGDVYLVIDTYGASPILVQDDGGAGLSHERLEAVLAGDAYRTWISAGFASGGEPYGNVNRLELTPGVHVFTTQDLAGMPLEPEKYALLNVTP
jgi:hypothetical protein